MNLQRYYGKHKPMCAICSQKGLLLCCDYCSLAYHPECLSPPLKSQPQDFWACPRCEYHAKSSFSIHSFQLAANTTGPSSIDPPITSKLRVGSAFQLKQTHSRFFPAFLAHSQRWKWSNPITHLHERVSRRVFARRKVERADSIQREESGES